VIESAKIEMKILEQIQHKNIVRLIGYCNTDTHIILMMDLFDCSLKNIIDTKQEKKSRFQFTMVYI